MDSPCKRNKHSPGSWPSLSDWEEAELDRGSFLDRLESPIFQSTSFQCARRWHSNVWTESSLSRNGNAGPGRAGSFIMMMSRRLPLAC